MAYVIAGITIQFEFRIFLQRKVVKGKAIRKHSQVLLIEDLVMADLVKTEQRKLEKINKGNKVWIEITFFDDEKVSIHYVFILI